MIQALRSFIDWVHAPEGGTPLALFRMLVGFTVMVTVGSVMVDGAVDLIWIDIEHGGYRHLRRPHMLVTWMGGATPEVMWRLCWISLAASLVLVLGIGGRVLPFVVLQLFSAVDINSHTGGSYDLLLKNALWLCVLCPTTATLSLDAWIWRGRPWRGRPVPAWARALVLFQLILVYWTTGLQKVSAHWVPGGECSALYYILQQPSWQLYDMRWTAWLYPFTQVATAVTWVWEVTVPLWLLAHFYRGTRMRGGWLRATFNAWNVRSIYAAIGLFFHGTLVFTLNVGTFPLISLAYYLCAWNEEEWLSMARGLRRFMGERLGRKDLPSGAGQGTLQP